PAHVRLDAPDQHDVAVGAARAAPGDGGRGPLDSPGHAVDELDGGTVDLEVVVFIGVDVDERTGVPFECEMLDRAAGGVCGVIPSLEGCEQNGSAQPGEVGHLLSVHRTSLRPNTQRGRTTLSTMSFEN